MKDVKKGYYFADYGSGSLSSIIKISGEAPFLRVKRIDLIEGVFVDMDSLDDVKLGERITQFDHLMGISK